MKYGYEKPIPYAKSKQVTRTRFTYKMGLPNLSSTGKSKTKTEWGRDSHIFRPSFNLQFYSFKDALKNMSDLLSINIFKIKNKNGRRYLFSGPNGIWVPVSRIETEKGILSSSVGKKRVSRICREWEREAVTRFLPPIFSGLFSGRVFFLCGKKRF